MPLQMICKKEILPGSMMEGVLTPHDLASKSMEIAKSALFCACGICPTVILLGNQTWVTLVCPGFASEDEKDAFSAEINRVVAIYDPRLLCFFHEAWTLNLTKCTPDEGEKLQEAILSIGGVKNHPARVECVYMIAESKLCHETRIAYIRRSKSGKIRGLAETEPMKHNGKDPLKGRFSGWLYKGGSKESADAARTA